MACLEAGEGSQVPLKLSPWSIERLTAEQMPWCAMAGPPQPDPADGQLNKPSTEHLSIMLWVLTTARSTPLSSPGPSRFSNSSWCGYLSLGPEEDSFLCGPKSRTFWVSSMRGSGGVYLRSGEVPRVSQATCLAPAFRLGGESERRLTTADWA